MNNLMIEFDVTEYSVVPISTNHTNTFCINEKSLIINMIGEDGEKVLHQTEISREDAIKLAKLILLEL